MEFDHRQLLSLLDDLMKPISTVKISSEDEEQQKILTINLIFSNAIDHFLEISKSISLIIPLNQDEHVYYRYIQIHINLIEKILSYEQKNISLHLPFFSIQDESILSRSLSFIILLGLVIHFDDGIFISIENYLKYSNTSIHLLKLKTLLTHHNRMYNINQILNFLMKSIINSNKNSFLIQRLCSNYLLELILSHLQLLYSPNLKYCSENFSLKNLQENLNYLQENFSNLFIQQILLLNRLLSTTINSPLWLKNHCGNILTSILINSNNHGIQQILETIFESTLPNDRLYISIAKIFSTCPKQLKPNEYIQCIKYQFIELIHNKRFMPVICISINELFKKYSKLIENEIFSILFQPLILCHNQLSNEICTNEQLELFIDDLDNLLNIISNEQIRIYLYENYLNELINIYIALEKSLSSLKIKFFNILKILFSSMNIEICIEYFKKILFDFKYLSLKYLPDLSIKFNLIIDKNNENNIEIYCQLIIKILFSIDNNDYLIVKIFLDLLQLLITNKQLNQSYIWTENDKQLNIKQYKIMLILKYTMEYLTEHIDIFIKNVDDTIKVVQIILEKITKTCQEKAKENLLTKITIDNDNDNDDDDLSSDNEALQIIFTIASLLITHYDQLSFENKQILASFYPSLIWIEQNHSNNELCQLAHELSIAFITYGAIKEQTTKIKSTLLIEELNNERDLREETFQNALTCLYDSSIPIRAHGLILFRRLIERNDKETLNKIENDNINLFQRFQEHLHADDSYEYLAAINVFNALTNQYTDKILPLLCNEYINKNRKLEDKLKVGEILVKTCRLLGDMSTKYSSLLINTFLNASKQTDDDMYRASALSNLGQLCTVLKYSLSKDLPEILIALKSYLSISESSNVRRASILVCELLCQSLEQSTWLTILGNELLSFYQLINYLYKNDKDDIVCLHAQIALEVLNKICQDYLQPSVILEKKIRILS
ncbi:unnamed protein product [Rotaria sordida]|uniref:RNA polymerase II assembly factor Rtp1 C-terminal domain-containing protein n=1 Tax=Rotaria sordida TaxID=392033 RepID=A0A813VHX3_9BILA|nr:unnamed protein product [Rotaria sordida]CAF3680546.1 unnamed protein product [Rotaria sordida]